MVHSVVVQGLRAGVLSRNFFRLTVPSVHLVSRKFAKCAETDLVRELRARIKMSGPITVAQYMTDVLTSPTSGYYMHRDVFGAKGDFITSPEISQMFGELVGVWCVNEWQQSGSPGKLQVVELGPGRGTLADDMLRVFSQFEGIREAVSLHLVEVSPHLSQVQEQKLCDRLQSEEQEIAHSETFYKESLSKHGSEVFWYDDLRKVPQGFSCFIAHEFFDALPVHKFQRVGAAWHEVMVDLDESPDTPHHFRFVLSRSPTSASSVLLQISDNDPRQHIELSPSSAVIVQDLAFRIRRHGGFSLIIDYGHSGEKEDTFRAFKEHKLFDPLHEPGTADLTADVDFAYLSKMATQFVQTYGPITQHDFLRNMGIGVRLQVLMNKSSNEERKNLLTSFDMLTNPEKMGERFKFFAMTAQNHSIPAGFME